MTCSLNYYTDRQVSTNGPHIQYTTVRRNNNNFLTLSSQTNAGNRRIVKSLPMFIGGARYTYNVTNIYTPQALVFAFDSPNSILSATDGSETVTQF